MNPQSLLHYKTLKELQEAKTEREMEKMAIESKVMDITKKVLFLSKCQYTFSHTLYALSLASLKQGMIECNMYI